MMNKTLITLLFFQIFLMGLLRSDAAAQSGKIAFNPEMFFNCSTKGEAWMLVDEQDIAGDPAAGTGGSPQTVFFPGWPHQDIYYPADVIIDLGVNHNFSSIWVFDVNDSDTLKVFTGTPAGWTEAGSIFLDQYNAWQSLVLNRQSRFVMLRFRSPACRIAEVVLYGAALGAPIAPPQPVPHPPRPMQQLIGINGFVDDPLLRIRAAGSLREYHDWQWDEGNTDTTYPGYPNNQYAWSPSWVSGPGWGWDFDAFYAQMKNAGISVNPVLQGAAPYITGFTDSLTQHKPITGGKNPALPSSYIEHADYTFQFAARYGQSNVPAGLLKLRSGQPIVSGLGLINYLENWNEPDKWWFGRGGYFHPFEFAAMCSADFDGHEGSLGPGKGIKSADPQMKMVMAGLASLNLEYVRCMKLWSDFNRITGFPADVLNFHHYSQNGQHGISPEADSLKYKLKKLVDWRNKYLPEKEVWLSEFGYDTNPESGIASRPIGSADAQEVQGRWLLRSLLAVAAAGVDRAHIFMLRDVNHPDPNIYNSSGLTGEIWFGHQPKKSWFYVKTFTKLLLNHYFATERSATDNRILNYRFSTANTDTITDVIWCSTSENLTIENYVHQVGLPSGNWLTTIYLLVNNDTIPINQTPVWNNGNIILNLSELPIFIRHIRTGSGSSSHLHLPVKLFSSSEPPIAAMAGNRFCATIFNPTQPENNITRCQADGNHLIHFEQLPSNTPLEIRVFEQTTTGLLGNGWLWIHWGGITGLDALILSYMAALNPITAQLSWIGPPPFTLFSTKIADTNSSGTLTALDALLLTYRSLGIPGTTPFPGNTPNHMAALQILQSSDDITFPAAPQIVLTHSGSFAANTIDSAFYYSTSLPPLQEADNYMAIYFISTGNLNASSH